LRAAGDGGLRASPLRPYRGAERGGPRGARQGPRVTAGGPAPPPRHPSGTPGPTTEWPTGPAGAVPVRAEIMLDAAFGADQAGAPGATHAVAIVQGGRLLAERYAEGFGPDVTCRSWSMAKSITQALVGLAV